jgi:hypothetical protein
MHIATRRFWDAYYNLPSDAQDAADKQFALLKVNPRHPSLQFKKVGKVWSARVNLSLMALAAEDGSDYIWFWIGEHREYEKLIQKLKNEANKAM